MCGWVKVRKMPQGLIVMPLANQMPTYDCQPSSSQFSVKQVVQ